MKKPNIAPGKWSVEIHDVESGLILVNNEIGSTVHDGFDIATSKAISAVPEMIDALIEAHKFLVVTSANMKNNRGNRPVEAFKKIEQALKKAGVEL